MTDRRPLISESSDHTETPEITFTASAAPGYGFSNPLDFSQPEYVVSPPGSPPGYRARPGYARLESDGTPIARSASPPVIEEPVDIGDSSSAQASGLGISRSRDAPPAPPFAGAHITDRSPVSPLRSPQTLSPPTTGNPIYGSLAYSSAESTPDWRRDGFSPQEYGTEYDGYRNTPGSEQSDFQQYLHLSDAQRLRGTSIRSAYNNDFKPTQECPTAKDFHISGFSWIPISIMILCFFSTVFSGLFLGLALKAPRYGRMISSQGSLSPENAILLTSVFAKLIELSFVTAFVAFLGQVLSRRAFMKEQGRGVTLSELSMWRWIVQPGTLLTHPVTARYSGLTVLGMLSLLSTILAALYSSASTAVVQPMLRSSNWDHRLLKGMVETDFANMTHVYSLCPTPIRGDAAGNATCIQIEHAGQAFHNYQRYLNAWDQVIKNKTTSSKQEKRPPGVGMLGDQTSITAQWIDIVDTPKVSREHGRAINNVSMAMPHAGIYEAARLHKNDIMQPEELDSEGSYFLRASVPSPVMNVLCAGMTEKELEPIIFQKWNNALVNGTSWMTEQTNHAFTTNDTVVDELFGWKKRDPTFQDYPPVFAKLPKPFNTIMNHTNPGFGRDTIYLLAQGGKTMDSDHTGIYNLCQIYMTITPKCSTHYNVTSSGGTMDAHCNDPHDKFAFKESNSTALEVTRVPNWRDVGFDWANSLSLNTGMDDGDAANARFLSQLMLVPDKKEGDSKDIEVDLNSQLPSIAEALAVLAGCTMLQSMQGAPFVDHWNHTTPLSTPETQYFNASLRAQQYASGGPDSASKAWITILFLVFVMNIFVLGYFLFHRGLVTDFSEPPNLFALAVNSPPSHLLAGSCGGGPQGKQYMVNWFVNTEGGHLYMEPGEVAVVDSKHRHLHPHSHSHAADVNGAAAMAQTQKKGFLSPITDAFERLRERGLHIGPQHTAPQRLRPVSVVDEVEMVDSGRSVRSGARSIRSVETSLTGAEEGGTSRQQRQYEMLAGRRSML